jgi:hypothetical protein
MVSPRSTAGRAIPHELPEIDANRAPLAWIIVRASGRTARWLCEACAERLLGPIATKNDKQLALDTAAAIALESRS